MSILNSPWGLSTGFYGKFFCKWLVWTPIGQLNFEAVHKQRLPWIQCPRYPIRSHYSIKPAVSHTERARSEVLGHPCALDLDRNALSDKQYQALNTPGSQLTFGVPKTKRLDNVPAKSKAEAVKNSQVNLGREISFTRCCSGGWSFRKCLKGEDPVNSKVRTNCSINYSTVAALNTCTPSTVRTSIYPFYSSKIW